MSQELPAIAKWSGGFLALTAALLSGLATFFNFGKQFEGHRGIADKYLKLAAKIETVIARYRDGFVDLGGLDSLLHEFQERYSEISDEAKAFPTSSRDFKVALESEALRAASVKDRQRDRM